MKKRFAMKIGSKLLPAFVLFVVGIHVVDAAPADAGAIVRDSGFDRGLCVVLDVTDGALLAELAKPGKFIVHGVATSDEAARKVREHVASLGLHGRVSVEAGDLAHLFHVSDLANLVVIENVPRALKNGLDLKEVARVLRPGSVACLGGTGEIGVVAGVEIVKKDDAAILIRKKIPEGLGEWTHWLHGPEGNSLSEDKLVGPPESLRWIDGPTWPMGYTTASLFANGRQFSVIPLGPTFGERSWRLIARDAWNGIILWTRDLASVNGFSDDTFVARGDRVFTVMEKNGPLVALDGATGDIVKTYDVGFTPRIAFHVDGVLVLCNEKTIVSVDPDTGAARWRVEAKEGEPFRHKTVLLTYGQYPHVVCGGGRLFVFIDDAKEPPFSLVAYDLDTGKEQWRVRQKGEILKYYRGTIALLDQAKPFSYDEKTLGTIRGVAASDGRTLWEHGNVLGIHADASAACANGLFWVNDKGMIGLDPVTGEEKGQGSGAYTGHCGFMRSTDRYLIGVYTSLIDLQKRRRIHEGWAFKNSCKLGNIPANGMLYNFPLTCSCLPYLRGFMAFSPEPVPEVKGAATEAERLVKGPAYGFRPDETEAGSAWPTLRHDPQRSAASRNLKIDDPKPLWDRAVSEAAPTTYGSALTAPVIAGGSVFVASPDGQEVVALDASTGEMRWRHQAPGRILSPPTLWRGLCLFGSNDGWVTCLRASDGEIVWRFRAAPMERRLVVNERVESSWPVPGVLVINDRAVFVAGRHSEFERGLFTYALGPATGEVIWENRISPQGKSRIGTRDHKFRWSDWAHANDILLSNGKYAFLGRLAIDLKGGELHWNLPERSNALNSGGSRAGSTIMPFGLVDGRDDLEHRPPGEYSPAKYQATFWSYQGVQGLILAFAEDRIFGVTVRGREWALFASPPRPAGEKKLPDPLWSHTVPVGSIDGLLVSGDILYVAGKNAEGKGVLTRYATSDGKKLGEVRFDGLPLFDGMAAADGRLYISTQSGKVFCFGEK